MSALNFPVSQHIKPTSKKKMAYKTFITLVQVLSIEAHLQ